MHNAVHGKTVENWKNKIDVRLVRNEKDIKSGHQNQAISHEKYLTMI